MDPVVWQHLGARLSSRALRILVSGEGPAALDVRAADAYAQTAREAASLGPFRPCGKLVTAADPSLSAAKPAHRGGGGFADRDRSGRKVRRAHHGELGAVAGSAGPGGARRSALRVLARVEPAHSGRRWNPARAGGRGSGAGA